MKNTRKSYLRFCHAFFGLSFTMSLIWLNSKKDLHAEQSHSPFRMEWLLGEIKENIVKHEYVSAHHLIDKLPIHSPAFEKERGRLALYELRCDAAARFLKHAADEGDDEVKQMFSISERCTEITAANWAEKYDDGNHSFEVFFQDESDKNLFPLISETLISAENLLSKDLHVEFTKPLRLVVVRDLLSLSAMTGLPYESATTTGTVAVAKWGRITLLSPGAMRGGYGWRDTLVHELTHLAVTRVSVDEAPLWLQEGLAKRFEPRWREPTMFDDKPSPELVVKNGKEKGIFFEFDKLGPSIAMLPSADAAAVAFAEVTSFVRYLTENQPVEFLPNFLKALGQKNGNMASLSREKAADVILEKQTGRGLQTWSEEWTRWLDSTRVPLDDETEMKKKISRNPQSFQEHLRSFRLAELLFGRKKNLQAKAKISLIPKNKEGSFMEAKIRHRRARIEEALSSDALTVLTRDLGTLESLENPTGEYWGARARMLDMLSSEPEELKEATRLGLVSSDVVEEADVLRVRGWSVDPYEIEVACVHLSNESGTVPSFSSRLHGLRESLCSAAKERNWPLIGRD